MSASLVAARPAPDHRRSDRHTMLAFWLIAALVCAGLVVALIISEIARWFARRGDPLARGRNAHRLVRRLLGGMLLLAALVVLATSPRGSSIVQSLGQRVLAALALCAAVLVVTLWDFRATRRDIKREMGEFVSNQARELHSQYLAKKRNASVAAGEPANAGANQRSPEAAPNDAEPSDKPHESA